MKFSFIFVSIFVLSIVTSYGVSAEESVLDPNLATLKNQLQSVESRKQALNDLATFPPSNFEEMLVSLLKNREESFEFRNATAEVLSRLNNERTRFHLMNLVFRDQTADAFSRQTGLSVLWQMIGPKEVSRVQAELVRLAQNFKESAEVRRFAIAYLAKGEGEATLADLAWIKEILFDQREPTPVRTSALSFLEIKRVDDFESILLSLIQNPSENNFFKQIAILQFARNFPSSIGVPLKKIFSNSRESSEVRLLSLQLLQNSQNDQLTVSTLKQMIDVERDSQLRQALQDSIDDLEHRIRN